MILQAILPSIASLIAFSVFGIILLITLAVAYAKRDVSISVTLLEYHR